MDALQEIQRLRVLNLLIDEARFQDENRYIRVVRRQLRDTFDPFHVSENLFISLYRVGKDQARNLIDSLQPHLLQSVRNTSIPPWMRVLATLNFYASGSYQRRVGQDIFNLMSQSSMSNSVREVTRAINVHLIDQWIHFPNTLQEIESIKERFMLATHFPGVIGCVDGTHVAIVPPKKEFEQMFLNRKFYHSKNVQMVFDYDLRILAINARHGGRTHDAHIWRMSAVRNELQRRYLVEGERGCWLLGDSGYPGEPWNLTPIPNHPLAHLPEGRYNQCHCSTRNCAERGIGAFKAKFRCCRKDRALHYSPAMAGLIINACAVIHNICVHHRLPNPPPVYDDIDLGHNQVVVRQPYNAQNVGGFNVFNEGIATRNLVVHHHFA